MIGLGLSLTTMRGGGLNPSAALLAALSDGAAQLIMHPLEYGSMFQDRAGTTPVTESGQLLGLALDWGQSGGMPVPGPELVTNGDFSDGSTGWAATGGCTISGVSGELEVTHVAASNGAFQLLTGLVVGRTYRMSVTGRCGTGDFWTCLVGASGSTAPVRLGFGNQTNTSNQTITGYFVATETSHRAYIRAGNSPYPNTAFFDNISIRELPGYHATAISDAARGIFAVVPETGRRNLLNNTPFAGVLAGSPGTIPTSWVLDINNASIALPSAEVIEISAAAQRTVFRQSITVAANEAATFSCNVEVVSGTVAFNQIMDMSIFAGPTYTYFMDGAPVTSTTVVPVGSHVLSVSVANDATERTIAARIGVGVVSSPTAVVRYNQPQFELGSTPTPYQRVGSQYDVTEVGKKSLPYIAYNGVNTAYQTPVLPAPGVDKAQVFAGVRKLSDAGQMLVGLGPNVNTSTGSFEVLSSFADANAEYAFASKGTLVRSAEVSNDALLAPVTNILSTMGDISGDIATLRINGIQVAQSTADQGTGNYNPSGTYPIYYGARAGTSLFFNGHHYRTLGPIARFGTNATPEQIAAAEAYYTEGLPA